MSFVINSNSWFQFQTFIFILIDFIIIIEMGSNQAYFILSQKEGEQNFSTFISKEILDQLSENFKKEAIIKQDFSSEPELQTLSSKSNSRNFGKTAPLVLTEIFSFIRENQEIVGPSSINPVKSIENISKFSNPINQSLDEISSLEKKSLEKEEHKENSEKEIVEKLKRRGGNRAISTAEVQKHLKSLKSKYYKWKNKASKFPLVY